jgi:hypothetical protein
MARVDAAVDAKKLARQVNDRVREVAEMFGYLAGDDFELAFVCECGCLEAIQQTPSAYDALGGRPLIAPGHPYVSPAIQP